MTATKGGISINSIGRGRNTSGTQKCGKITIGGTVYWGLKEGSSTAYEYKNGGDTYLTTSPLTYQP